jgi:hypothetical protein
MKKKISMLLAVSLFLASVAAVAQARFGFKAGVNFSYFKVTESSIVGSYNSMTGFAAGGTAILPLGSGKLSLRPELLYSVKGTDLSANESCTLNYLELPIPLTYQFEIGSGHFYSGLGPYFAFGLAGNYKAGNQEQSITFGTDFKSFDWGLVFEGGYQFDMGVNINIRNNLGLFNINGPGGSAEVYNRTFHLSVGYLF